MKRYSFRITKPVKEKEHSFLEKQLKPISEFLTIPKPIEYVSVDTEQDSKPNLAKALIKGLETNNYNLFGDLLLASKRKDEEKPHINKPANEVISEFTNALIAKDLNALADLLDNKGAFMVINKTFETVAVIKEQYVNWLRFKLQTESVTQVDMDSCTGCSLGKTVVIYNNGKFPWVANKMGDSSKGGLDFKIANGKITQIKFCYKFKNTKNQFGFEKRYNIYKSYLDKGFTKEEADKLSEEEWRK
jgi:hypothetical protein